MLYDTLVKANLEAYKAKDQIKKKALAEVISKCKYKIVELRGSDKTLDDNIVIDIIKKVVKDLDEELSYFKDESNERFIELSSEKAYLKTYLPQELTKEEIIKIVSNLEDKSLPNIMKHFKMNYQGKCDMKLVNEVARSFQNK